MVPWFGRGWEQRLAAELDARTRLEGLLSITIQRLDAHLAEHPNAEDANEAGESPSPSSLVREGLLRPGELLSALTVFGLAVFAVLWVAYSSFYNQFGLRPEDVGLTYTAVLIRAGVGGGALILVVLASLIPLQILFSPESPGYPQSPWGLYAAWGSFVLCFAVYWFLPAGSSRILSAFVLAGTFLSLVFLLFWLFDRRLARLVASRDLSSRSTMRRIVVTGIAILLLFGLLYLPYLAGLRAAKSVKNGRADTGGLDAHVVHVHVVWAGTEPPELPAQPRFMYLGEADQTTILYETVGGQTYRVPSQFVLLTQTGGTG